MGGISTLTPGELAERWLVDAYALLEQGWCQGAQARDALGEAVEPTSDTASAWSITGAISRAWATSGGDGEIGLTALQLANLALAAAVNDVPASWNDAPGRSRTHALEAVLAAVTLARDPVLFGVRR